MTIDSLSQLEAAGARFCRVSPWNSKGESAGKNPSVGGVGWHTHPLTLADVTPYLAQGENVGLLCGQASGGIGLLDIDGDLEGFFANAGQFRNYPRIARDGEGGAERAKIIVRLSDDWPARKWKVDGEKSPFMEWLWTGNQGVIPPSRHPNGTYYRLVNGDQPIPVLNSRILDTFTALWAETKQKPVPVDPPAIVERPHNDNGDGLRETVRQYWTPLKVFEHFGMVANGTKTAGQWTRLFGNGGLFVHENGATWALPAGGKGWGGDSFDAWWYAKTGTREPKVPQAAFRQTLVEMATAAGIAIPEHKPAQPPEPEPPADWDTQAEQETALQAPLPAETKTPQGLPWQAFTLADAYQENTPTEWLVDNLFELRSLCAVFGSPGGFKSFFVAELAISVAGGLPFLPPGAGEEVKAFSCHPAPVVWVDFDNGRKRTAKRFAALGRARKVGANTPLAYYSMPDPWLDAGNKVLIAGLAELVKERGAKLVVLDNLGLIAPGKDENSTEMIQVCSNLRWMAEYTGACVVFIHHQRKSNGFAARKGETMRGSSSIEAAIDLALCVERSQEKREEIIITATKTRGVDIQPFGALFAFENSADGELHAANFFGRAIDGNPIDAAIAKIEMAVKYHLTLQDSPNQGQLVELVKSSFIGKNAPGKGKITAVLKAMVAKGEVRETKGLDNACCYRLPEEAEE